ncbi:MAG: glycosyl hydrolase family 32, partial [Prevotella sp.]|nr:glycosyl hydrolase family 32 [Prevotella sp.]
MKQMIYSLALTAVLATPLYSCSNNDDNMTEPKDWMGTTAFFSSTDEQLQSTYYKPYSGYVGDPMPFYDPVAKDFKILYLQD